MKFVLNIDIGNSGMLVVQDVASALTKVANKLVHGHGYDTVVLSLAGCEGKILDRNGNTVGQWQVDDG